MKRMVRSAMCGVQRWVRSAGCGVLSLLAIIALIGQPARAQVFTIANDYLRVDVNTQNGNMTILTVQGDPTRTHPPHPAPERADNRRAVPNRQRRLVQRGAAGWDVRLGVRAVPHPHQTATRRRAYSANQGL
jgi:hypothetical protein